MTKKIKIKIVEGSGCDPCSAAAPLPKNPRGHMHTSDCEKPGMGFKNVHNNEEARMHRTTLAHLMADVKVLLDLISDADDLPEWLETKITKAGDYMSSAARYIAGNIARDQGQLEEESQVSMTMERPDMIQRLSELADDELARLLSLADLSKKNPT